MAEHPPQAFLTSAACLLLLLLALPVGALASTQACSGLWFPDASITPTEKRAICQTAERLRAFLAQCGIRPSKPISVRFTDRLAELHHPHAIAEYDVGLDRITLLDRAHAISQLPPGTPFSRLSADDIHTSLLAHELAHAIVLQQPGSHALPRMAHEYIAAVAQVAILPAAARETLLQAFPRRGPVETAALNGFNFHVAPQWFTVNAYRHYAAAPDGCARLRAVLDGSLRFVDNPE